MKIIRNFSHIPNIAKESIIALGNFDGLHLGHQEIIKEVKAKAKLLQKKTALMTFFPHPQSFFNNKQTNIFKLRDKVALIKEQNIDFLFLIHFDHNFANLSAEEFVRDFLTKKLQVKHIVIGYDFIFGKNRSGNATYLQEAAKRYAFGFSQVASHKVTEHNLIYSSSQVRLALTCGDIKKANLLLGKNYFITNRVINGEKRGRSIGFRTINLALNDLFSPKYGVYAVWAHIAGKKMPAIANLGIRPSFKENTPLLEVHIFNFSGDLYNHKVKIEFVLFIRAEQKFANKESLAQQIKTDCQKAQEILYEA